MPIFSEHNPSRLVKMLLLGDSGSGKTGALASLANAGYKLRIHDFDNGLDILRDYVKPEYLDNIRYVTITDKLSPGTQGASPTGVPTAWTRAMKSLKSGEEFFDKGDEEACGIYEWGDDVVYVCDSLTMMGQAAMRFVLSMNGRLTEHPWQSDWGEAMEKQERFLELLYSDRVKCHVIVTSHIMHNTRKDTITNASGKEVQVEVEDPHGFPSALGRKLPPKVGRYFNTMLRVVARGRTTRVIEHQPDGEVDLKSTIPNKLKGKSLKLENGLAEFFELQSKPQ